MEAAAFTEVKHPTARTDKNDSLIKKKSEDGL